MTSKRPRTVIVATTILVLSGLGAGQTASANFKASVGQANIADRVIEQGQVTKVSSEQSDSSASSNSPRARVTSTPHFGSVIVNEYR